MVEGSQVRHVHPLGGFKTVEMGNIELEKGATSGIRLQAMPDGWKPANVFSVELVPVK